MEMHRQGRGDQQLVSRRADEVSRVDTEARQLARALDNGERLDDLVSAGILGACGSCGTLLSTGVRYCSDCGAQVTQKAAGTTPASGNNATTNGSPQPAAAAPGSGESAGMAGER